MKAKAQPEPVGKRQPVIDDISDIDRRVLLSHVACHDVAAVRCHIEADMRRAPGRPAFEHRPQTARGIRPAFEGKIIDKCNRRALPAIEDRKDGRQIIEFACPDLDKGNIQPLRLQGCDRRFDQRGFPASAHSPKEDVVCGISFSQTPAILDHGIALRIDAGQERQWQRHEPRRPKRIVVPDIGWCTLVDRS